MGRKTMEVGKDRQGETQELVLIWELLPTNPFQIAPWICYDTKGFFIHQHAHFINFLYQAIPMLV